LVPLPVIIQTYLQWTLWVHYPRPRERTNMF
jgi:hypothetical protein